jgi:hypothetical protein|tara:strand:+ start:1396 stop:1704 length:309 start_codon:yes stop_codon:yes gene_type:complete
MEIISVIILFIFGDMTNTEDRLTQYVPVASVSECLKEKRILARDEEFKKDAFCGEALVEMKDGVVITLHSELPEGAILVDKEVSKQALKEWTLRAKEKWENK